MLFVNRKKYNSFEVLQMKSLKEKVSITLDEDIVAMVKEMAEEDDRSFSQCINIILKNYFKSKKATAKQ